jgi:hypothetical protein
MEVFHLAEELKNEIIEGSVDSIKALLWDGRVTIVEVLLTFIERTIRYGYVNNWLSDIIFQEAFELAL